MTLPVTAIVVSYNTRDHLGRCLESLDRAKRRGELDRIIVVDCASNDGSPDMVGSLFPEVMLIEIPNRGYGAAANAGMAASDSDYSFILNADTIVKPGSTTALFEQIERRPGVGLAGPRLLNLDGSIQPSRRRFPSRLTPLFESTIIQEYLPSNPWASRYYVEDQTENTIQYVDWVVGAALFVRRTAVVNAGGFDIRFRMFSEEVEWCFRFMRHGWQVLYVPAAEVIHEQGASTSQDVPARQLDFDTSRIELQRRMYGNRAAKFTELVVRLNYLLHLFRESLKWMVGHRRELRSERIRFYGSALTGSGSRFERSGT